MNNEKTYVFGISELSPIGMSDYQTLKDNQALVKLSYFLEEYTETANVAIKDNVVTVNFIATADQVYYLWLMTSEKHNPYDYKPEDLRHYSWLRAYQRKIHNELENTWKAIRSERTNSSEIEMSIHVPNQMLDGDDGDLKESTNELLTIFFSGSLAEVESHMLNTIITGTVHLEYMQKKFDAIVEWVHSNEETYSKYTTINELVSQMLSLLRNTFLDWTKDFAPEPDVTFVFGDKTLDTSDDAAAVGAYITLKGETSRDGFKITNGNTSVSGNKDGLTFKADKITLDGVSSYEKYVSGYKDKENPIQDLEKAQENIQMIIDLLKKEN